MIGPRAVTKTRKSVPHLCGLKLKASPKKLRRVLAGQKNDGVFYSFKRKKTSEPVCSPNMVGPQGGKENKDESCEKNPSPMANERDLRACEQRAGQ